MELPFSLSICGPQKWPFTWLNDCFCPFGQQTRAACWTDSLSPSVSLSLRLFSAFVSASLLGHFPYSFAFPPSPPPPFSPFLGPAQRAEGRGQAGVSRARKAHRPCPTTGGLSHPGEHKGSPLAWGVSGPSLFLFGQAFAGGVATSLGGR